MAFAQAAFAAFVTLVLILVGVEVGGSVPRLGVAGSAQFGAVVLLVFGGIRLLRGRGRWALTVGAATEVVLSVIWVIAIAMTPGAILFAATSVVILILAWLPTTSAWLRGQRARSSI